MPKSSLFDRLCESCNMEVQEDESLDHFARRAVKKINSLGDDDWKVLPEPVQKWANDSLKAMDATKKGDDVEWPELDGFPTPEEAAADDADSGDDSSEEEATGEAAEESSDEGGEAAEDGGEEEATEGVDEEATSEEDAGGGEEGAPVERVRPKAAKKPAKSAGSKKTGASSKSESKGKSSKEKTMRKSSVNANSRIKVVAKENPHRAGTKLFNYFKKYKDGMTVAAAEKAGIPPKNIQYLAGLGHIKLIKAA